MLTPDQLAAIKSRLDALPAPLHQQCALDYIALLNELERLTRHNKRMSAALAQLSDKENWADVDTDKWQWMMPIDPQQLAERALVEDGVAMPFIDPTNKHTCQLPNLSGLSTGTQWYCEHCNRLYIISLSPENKQVSWYLYGVYNPMKINQSV